MNEGAKPSCSRLFFLEKRGTSKTNIAGVGEYQAHGGMGYTILAPVALVHQYENVDAGVRIVPPIYPLKFINDGGDNIDARITH